MLALDGSDEMGRDARISGAHPAAKDAGNDCGNVDDLREREKEIQHDRDREGERTGEATIMNANRNTLRESGKIT